MSAFPGPFLYTATVTNQSNSADTATSSVAFTISGTKYVRNSSGQTVTYYSQWKNSTDGLASSDCGPTSVAMVLNYLGKAQGGTNPWDQIKYVRTSITNRFGKVSPYPEIIGSWLEYGLTHLSNGTLTSDGTPNGVLDVHTGQFSPVPSYQENWIAAYLTGNHPAVVLVNASSSIPSPNLGRPYDGHWLVVIGTYDDGTNAYMIVNDPDDNYTKISGPATIWLPTFGNALQYVDTESDNYQGIVGWNN